MIYRTMTERLVERASEITGFAPGRILGGSRHQPLFMVRAAICLIMRDYGLTAKQIGQCLDRDRTTILNACRRGEYMLERDDDFRALHATLAAIVDGHQYAYAPVDRFLAMLAQGWTFPNDIAQPCLGHHGAWSTRMVR